MRSATAMSRSLHRSPPPGPPRARRRATTAAAGFTLTELMVVVVIIGIMAAISTPLLTRDNQVNDGRELTYDVARELQRCRSEAVSSRLGIRAFVYVDRVELRSYKPGATPGAAPTAPVATDPTLRIIRAKPGVAVLDVVGPSDDPPAKPVLTAAGAAQIDFFSTGGAQLVGAPVPTGAVIYIQNSNLPSASKDFAFRVDVTALTAFVAARNR